MQKYLYGCSVQGIQSFIFETNKLKEIVGGSTIVDFICTTYFDEILEINNISISDNDKLMQAAGNVKVQLQEDDLKKVYRAFPKYVMQKAPGITISQAYIPIKGKTSQKDINLLELKLKSKRNRIVNSNEYGFMICQRDRSTGGVAKFNSSKSKDNTFITLSRQKKIKASEYNDKNLLQKIVNIPSTRKNEMSHNISDIVGANDRSFIAVLHADGNGLGKILSQLGDHVKDDGEGSISKVFKEFSKKLNEATKESVSATYEKHKVDLYDHVNENYRFRPVLIGGDDITIILPGAIAIDFTNTLIEEFERQTKKHFKDIDILKDGLTICAGISYIKVNYPFHFAVDLAEELCKEAKKESKALVENKEGSLPPSSLSFYKVQSSFLEPLTEMRERSQGDLIHGVYFKQSQDNEFRTIDYLVGLLNDNNGESVAKVRQILSMFADKKYEEVKSFIDRVEQVDKTLYNNMMLKNLKGNIESCSKKENDNKFENIGRMIKNPIYDLLAIQSIN